MKKSQINLRTWSALRSLVVKTLGAGCLMLAAATNGYAQEPTRPPLPMDEAGANDDQQKMQELFAKVERNLRRIDLFLSDAAAGELPLGSPEESGLADLLRETQQASQSTINDIDEILKIASQQKSSNQSGGQSDQNPPPPNGESPLDKPQSGAPQEQESTPEKPQPDSAPEQKPEGSQPEEDGADEPKDGENNLNSDPSPTEPGPPAGVNPDGERWGELPPRVREVFRSQGGGDLPTQYRDWIDSYYRRLNKRP